MVLKKPLLHLSWEEREGVKEAFSVWGHQNTLCRIAYLSALHVITYEIFKKIRQVSQCLFAVVAALVKSKCSKKLRRVRTSCSSSSL